MNEARALEIVSRVLRLARSDAAVVGLGGDTNAFTRMADNLITQNVRTEGSWLSVSCAFGRRHGSASTNGFSDESLRAVVRRAESIAKVVRPDPEYMPPLPKSETKSYPVIKDWAARTLAVSPLDKARALAKAVRQVKAAHLRLSGGWGTGGSFYAVGNSLGLRAWHQSTNAEAHMTVLGGAGSGWAQEMSHDCADVDVARIVDQAASIAARARRPADLAPGKYTLIMPPAAAAELLMFALWPFDAKAADEGRSFLRGQLGRQVFGRNVTIRTDPGDPRCPGGPFDGDGFAARPITWIRRGVVENLIYSRFWAKKKRKTPTGWPVNHIMDGEGASVDAMIASTERGLLVTRFWYVRYVDPMLPSVTGMTRDGLFLIRNGRLAGPVRQMRFNENLRDMLNRVEMTGSPARAGLLVPALKIRDFNFTSATRFA